MGLLLTMHLQRREQELHIFGPAGLNDIITTQLKHSGTALNYKVHFTVVDPNTHQEVLETETLKVYSLPLTHRIPCAGFLFKEKPKERRFNKSKLEEGMTGDEIVQLKEGRDVLDTAGNLKYSSVQYTLPPRPSRSYAYCSDTKYEPALIPLIKNVDLLYHESTFGKEYEQRAEETYHSTAQQAAKIASQAEVGQLMLGHFSVRYRDLNPLLTEAKEEFTNTCLAIEGESYSIGA
jgi:ribonuclease Z